ncbi:hypothetical protein DFJ63DRAFT_310814 [Scheffersomyces coipomensis]|uniref:uncharacterized protein n=1 Tax=Scheffersomyces coipomensis TaxID=1788519 RepID=UPI00315D49E2
MATAKLLESIHDNNTAFRLPESVYDDNISKTYASILSKTNLTSTDAIEFDPYKHLSYYNTQAYPNAKSDYDATKTISMEQLGLSQPDQISETGVSDPFPLFTEEAVEIMRQEILNKEIFMNFARYSYSSTSGMDCVLRGYVKNDDKISTPFIYKAWSHPKTMELINKKAGVDLEIIMDYEIAHVNIAIKNDAMVEKELAIYNANNKVTKNTEDMPAVVGWHRDSYPFVCVLMLSDTTNMIGGETGLKTGTGEIAVVPGPKLGSAAILQGRMIEHIAKSPIGMTERITMVTSYRAKDPVKKDTSVLSTVKPELNFGSRFHDFYNQWIDYRVELIKQKLDILNNTSRDDNGKFQKDDVMNQLKEIEAYVTKTYKEMEVSPEEWAKALKKHQRFDSFK